MRRYFLLFVSFVLIPAAPAQERNYVHLYGYDQVNVVNKCMLGLSKGTDVIIKGSVQLKDQAPSEKWRVFMEVRRYFSTAFKRFCSINLSRCEELRSPSKCYCKRKPNSLNFDIYFNFTLDVIHSHAEIRMKLLTDNTPVYSNVKRLPTIYQQVPLTLTVNGFEVEPRNCIFNVNSSDPKVEFCCDADYIPCYSAIMRNGQVVAGFNSSCAVLEDARPLRASYVFKYNVCSEKDKKLQFACKPLLNDEDSKRAKSEGPNEGVELWEVFVICTFEIVGAIVIYIITSKYCRDKFKKLFIYYHDIEDLQSKIFDSGCGKAEHFEY